MSGSVSKRLESPDAGHAELMDGVYRVQRHFYDATRKYYLLGRDRMIAGLDVPPGGTVLELGCGTGRNIVLTARKYPQAHYFGLDISTEMLTSARKAVEREGMSAKVMLERGDATGFDAQALFGRASFDRVFVSYALSMIPGWEKTIALGLEAGERDDHVAQGQALVVRHGGEGIVGQHEAAGVELNERRHRRPP